MPNQETLDVLSKLHDRYEIPRLEIEGAGEPSIQAMYLGWIRSCKKGEGDESVYVINDWYEDTSYVTEFRVECLLFPKSGIEKLVEDALRLGNQQLTRKVKGIHHRHYERWDDYTGSHDGGSAEERDVMVALSLSWEKDNPILSVSYHPLHLQGLLPD